MTKINFRVDSSENFKAANTELTKGEPTISNSFPYELKISPSDGSTWDSAISIKPVTEYTPSTTNESYGEGLITFDNNFLYIKTSSGWKQIALVDLGDITSPPQPPPVVTTTTTTVDPNATTTTSTTTTVDPNATTTTTTSTTTTVDPNATTTTTTTSTTTTTTTTADPNALRVVFDEQVDVNSFGNNIFQSVEPISKNNNYLIARYLSNSTYVYQAYYYDQLNQTWSAIDNTTDDVYYYYRYDNVALSNDGSFYQWELARVNNDRRGLPSSTVAANFIKNELVGNTYLLPSYSNITSEISNFDTFSDLGIAFNDNGGEAYIHSNGVYIPSFNNLQVSLNSIVTDVYGHPRDYARSIGISNNFAAITFRISTSVTASLYVYNSSGQKLHEVLLPYITITTNILISNDESKIFIFGKYIDTSGTHSILYVLDLSQQDTICTYLKISNNLRLNGNMDMVGVSDDGSNVILFNRSDSRFYGFDTSEFGPLSEVLGSTQNVIPTITSIAFDEILYSNSTRPTYSYLESDNRITVFTESSAGNGNILTFSLQTSDNGLLPNFASQTTTTTTPAPDLYPEPDGSFKVTSFSFNNDIKKVVTALEYVEEIDEATASSLGLTYNVYKVYKPLIQMNLYLRNNGPYKDSNITNVFITCSDSAGNTQSKNQTIAANLSWEPLLTLPVSFQDPNGGYLSTASSSITKNGGFVYMRKDFDTSNARQGTIDFINNRISASLLNVAQELITVNISSNNYITLSNLVTDLTSSITSSAHNYPNQSLYYQNIISWGYAINTPSFVDLAEDDLTIRNIYLNDDHQLKYLESVPSTIPSWFTDLSFLFCGNQIFTQDLSTWDTSNIQELAYTFCDSNYNQDLSSWDVSSCWNFDSTFRNCAFSQPLSSWDMSSAVDLNYMFDSNQFFNQDISSWNTAIPRTMLGMFKDSVFNQDISSWNTASCTNMASMFENNSVFNHSVSSWNVRSLNDCSEMFNNATSFNQNFAGWILPPTLSEKMRNFCKNTSVNETNIIATCVDWSSTASFMLAGTDVNFGPASVTSPTPEYLTAFFALQNKNINIVDGS